MLISLGPQFLLSDRTMDGQPGRAWGVGGYGIPRWGAGRMRNPVGPMKPMPIGARYFCGDCDSHKTNEPVAQGSKFGASKKEYQEAVTAHIQGEHPDLHYPIDQDGLDAVARFKRHQASHKRQEAQLKELAHFMKDHPGIFTVEGGVDVSGSYQEVKRPRELPDLTEFDFPDADVADGGIEEIELDQLISIAARQGRRLLGAEFQNMDFEFMTEFLTAPDNADLEISAQLELNTRTGAQNLDDPENLWRWVSREAIANIESTAGVGTALTQHYSGVNEVIPGGRVYVSPRLFLRFSNSMDRQVDTGDLFFTLATIAQPLSTFLLFELLEQHSGLFALT